MVLLVHTFLMISTKGDLPLDTPYCVRQSSRWRHTTEPILCKFRELRNLFFAAFFYPKRRLNEVTRATTSPLPSAVVLSYLFVHKQLLVVSDVCTLQLELSVRVCVCVLDRQVQVQVLTDWMEESCQQLGRLSPMLCNCGLRCSERREGGFCEMFHVQRSVVARLEIAKKCKGQFVPKAQYILCTL